MIAVKLEGRLGNQLFQYAFAYASAKKLKTSFYLDKSVDYFILPQYFEVQKDFCAFFDEQLFSVKGYKNIFSYHARRTYYFFLKRLLQLKSVTFFNDSQPIEQLKQLTNQTLFHGFFQSEEYFAPYDDEIINQFNIKPVYKNAFESIFNTLKKNSRYVVVHIRRGDYIDCNYALPVNYYHDIIKNIHSEGNFYIFVSDDPEFVKNEFKYIKQCYISQNEAIVDLQFLIKADVCILSNSSFSWWGAWLNKQQHKEVYCPLYYVGFREEKEYPLNIYPDAWKKIKV